MVRRLLPAEQRLLQRLIHPRILWWPHSTRLSVTRRQLQTTKCVILWTIKIGKYTLLYFYVQRPLMAQHGKGSFRIPTRRPHTEIIVKRGVLGNSEQFSGMPKCAWECHRNSKIVRLILKSAKVASKRLMYDNLRFVCAISGRACIVNISSSF